MENVQVKPGIGQKIVSLAILGLLMVVLAGPLMTIVSFAAIGFAGWLIYRAFVMGKEVAWGDAREAVKLAWRNVTGLAGWLCSWAGDGLEAVRRDWGPTGTGFVARGFARVKGFAVGSVRLVRKSFGLLTQIFIEAVSAGVIGALLSGFLTSGPKFSEESIILGAVIGGLVGAIYGARFGRPVRPSTSEAEA